MATSFDDQEFNDLEFDDTARRKALADSPYNGIDLLEVDATPGESNQRVLRLYFIAPGPLADPTKVTTLLDDLDGNIDAFVISGGTRVRNVRVETARRREDHIELGVNRAGDFSDYVLRVVYPAGAFPLDLFYSEIVFNFKAGCPARFDCRQPLLYPPETPANLYVDYLAKDYESFRQALIDLLPKLIPDWKERRAADLGMTLLELLAYTGDQLSYLQDAVANEAYLETARQRISARLHARLIDYHMHDGLSAATVVQLQIGAGALTLAAKADEDRIVRVLTRVEGLTLPLVIPPEREEEALAATETIYEIHLHRANPDLGAPPDEVHFHQTLNELPLYAWGNQIASLRSGATSADLVGDLKYDATVPGQDEAWRLKQHDLIILEEVKDPFLGEIALADPNRRHLVRLTAVETLVDELASTLTGTPVIITRVFWDEADALPFRVWINNMADDGTAITNISVGRGNLVVANYGRSYREWFPREPQGVGDRGGIRVGERALRLRLQEGPLAFTIPRYTLADRPAGELRSIDPQFGLPAIHRIDSITQDASGAERRRLWQVVSPSLLNSDRFAEDVVVETDNLGRANLRFGDNEHGALPDENSFFEIHYRVGIGAQGNIGADKLTHIVRHADVGAMASITAVRNVLPAWGGAAPQSIEEVKRLAPAALRATLKRAVTEADYAQITEMHPRVERALATFRWTGSWHTVFICVDPASSTEASSTEASSTEGDTGIDDALRQELLAWVSRFSMTGYDLEIIEPSYIPLELMLEICVEPGYFSSDIERSVLDVLSNRRLLDGSTGFFHPDNFTFGQRLYLSQIYAAVEKVAGVQSVTVAAIHRQFAPDPLGETRAHLARGYIDVGAFAVIRLDNSPNFPENGIIRLVMLGGNA